MRLHSMHPYAVVCHARDPFEEDTMGDLHTLKQDLVKKCTKDGNCNVVNLLPTIHCAVDISLKEDGGGGLWQSANKVAHNYRISVYFLEEIKHCMSQSLIVTYLFLYTMEKHKNFDLSMNCTVIDPHLRFQCYISTHNPLSCSFTFIWSSLARSYSIVPNQLTWCPCLSAISCTPKQYVRSLLSLSRP